MARKKTSKRKRREFDWELIHREWRTNQFSDAELSRRHGCSRAAIQKRRDKEGWVRDLSEDVRILSNAKLISEDAKVAGEVAGCNADGKVKSEVELAAETRVSVVRSHRKDISTLMALEQQLLMELADNPQKAYVCNHKGVILSQNFDLAVTDKSAALNNLANVQHKRIQLERQAFNIQDDDALDDKVEKVVYEIIEPPERDD